MGQRRRHVYFIKPVGMDGPVKIGCAVLAKERVAQLALWSPFELEMVACMEGGLDLEERFHAYFIEDHYRQEWFHFSAKMEAAIQSIQQGKFDVSVLPASLGPIRHAARYYRTETPEELEYRRLYVECKNLPWARGHSWPIVPSIFKTYSPERRARALAGIRECMDARRKIAA